MEAANKHTAKKMEVWSVAMDNWTDGMKIIKAAI